MNKRHLAKRQQLTEDIKYLFKEIDKAQSELGGNSFFNGGNFGVIVIKYLDKLWDKRQ
jgi:hypothetical protein